MYVDGNDNGLRDTARVAAETGETLFVEELPDDPAIKPCERDIAYHRNMSGSSLPPHRQHVRSILNKERADILHSERTIPDLP